MVNTTAPELDYLAARLDQRDYLRCYVRPYATALSGWSGAVRALPGAGLVFDSTLGRRRPPTGLEQSRIVQAGRGFDIAQALLSRVSHAGVGPAARLGEAAIHARTLAVSNTGARAAAGAEVVVCRSGVALGAFKTVQATGGRALLDYPIAHHRALFALIREESELEPEFSGTFAGAALPAWLIQRMDEECEKADLILVGSRFARNSFSTEGFGLDRLMVIPYGVDLDLFVPRGAPRSSDDPFRVLFVGQVDQRKGISYLLRAYAQFSRSDTELVIVGNLSGHDRAPFRKYDGLFRHVPNVPRRRLPSWYQSADVFVFPTLMEGLGLVVLEAMASGLPVIVTPNGPDEVVRNEIDGFIVPARDPEAIVMSLDVLYRDPERRVAMGRNARERALAYGWDTYTERAAEVVVRDPAS